MTGLAMGQSETYADNDSRGRLLETAKAMVLRGDNAFSVGSVCTEAGVDRTAFRAHFSGRTALMAALMQAPGMAELAMQAPEQIPEQVSKAAPESSVSTPDAWLERRLRVFERALNALEAKAESVARDHARAIALLEERLNAASGFNLASSEVLTPVVESEPVQQDLAFEPQVDHVVAPAEEPPAEEMKSDLVFEPPADRVVAPAEEPPAEEMKSPPPEIPAAMVANKQEMAGVLQNVREKVRVADPQTPPPPPSARARWLAIGAASLVALLLCIGISLGKNVLGATAREDDGITHRQLASGKLAQTIALADAGNTRAQARLALAYLRGQGSAGDANAALLWTRSAAQSGNPVAQYLMGVMYQQGDHVTPDLVVAYGWFSRAAEKGNLKAMHNLAIAYAQGRGTAKDEAKAAEWFTRAAERGYVDSAFDLAVLYERGAGVPQDLRQALKWYGIAAMAGDAPAKERVDFLHGQMNAQDIKLAANAATSFSPLPALDEANTL
ncbi:MAG TPA: tetratricopeptide repeat protein [Rhizomicrobium sp.]|nr:tetratricopeptide repeat protein [Rhizomicrobium sp.]